jgi:hypothetical protein
MTYYQPLHAALHAFTEICTPVSYLEVGVREGDSLQVVLLNGCPGTLYLCDNWGVAAGGTGRGSHAHIDVILAKVSLQAKPVYLDGDSHKLLSTIKETFQLITVDGDHSEKGADQDLEDCWPLLEANGFLFFDDICHPAHTYLSDVAKKFVARHSDGRITYWRTDCIPGLAIFQKVQA